jgi:hypothetical protein
MNLIGRFRSNYFAVKDRAAFEAWCRQLHLRPITDDDDPNLVGFLNDGNEAGIPWTLMDGDDFQDIDFIGELGDFLLDNQVAIVIEIAYEGYRYLGGIAYAINNKGEEKRIDLADIMTQAKPLGEHVTKCEY